MPWFWPIGRSNTIALAWRSAAARAQRRAAEADRLGREQDALGVHAVQDVVEALAFLADAVLDRDRAGRR